MATSKILPASSNPYGGGGLIFDSTPYTQYHLQRQAHEQAKEEALDKYFRELDTKINTSGVRTQDIPDLIKQQNADRLFYLQNKEAIKKPSLDNGKAYNEYMQRHQSKLAYVNQSKNEGEKYKQMVPIFADPTKRALMTDEALAALELHDLPITNPNRKSFDITQMQYNPKPFDVVGYQKGLPVKEVKGAVSFENAPDYATSYLRTPITSYYPNYDKNALASIAESKYTTDPSYRKLINDLSNNKPEYERLNKIYKENFGTDIQYPQQLAIANTLSYVPQARSERGKPEIDQVAFQAAKYRQAEADRRERQRRGFAQQDKWLGMTTDPGNAFSTFGAATPFKLKLPSGKQFGTVSGGFVTDVDGKPVTGKFKIDKANVPSSIRGILKANGLNPDDIDNNVEIIYDDGKIKGVDFGSEIGVIDEATLNNFQLKANTEPLKGKQPTWVPNKPQVKKENKTFVFPKGKAKF